MEVSTYGVKVEADTADADKWKASMQGMATATDKASAANVKLTQSVTTTQQSFTGLSTEQRAFQVIANRTGETWQQVQQRFSQGSTILDKLTKKTTEHTKVTSTLREQIRLLAESFGLSFRQAGVMTRGLDGAKDSHLAMIGVIAGTTLAVRGAIDWFDKYEQSSLKIAEQQLKLSDALDRQAASWLAAAKAAQTYADAAKIGIAAIGDIQSAQDAARNAKTAARAGPGVWSSTFETIAGFILTGLTAKTLTDVKTFKPFSDGLNEAAKAAKIYADATTQAAIASERLAESNAIQVAHLSAMPLYNQAQSVRGTISGLEQQRNQINPETNFRDWAQVNDQIAEQQKLLDGVILRIDEYAKATDELTLKIQANYATGNPLEESAIRAKQAFEQEFQSLKKLSGDAGYDEAKQKAQAYADSVEYAIRKQQEQSDTRTLVDALYKIGTAQLFITDKTELQERSFETAKNAIKGMIEPMSHVAVLAQHLIPGDAALLQWEAYDQTVERSLAKSEERMKANMATMGEVVATGLSRMSYEWGSFETQAEQAIKGVGNALANDISAGLVDILTGAKNLQDGFRTMALAIIRDIEQIILKMLVQLAIQQVINAVSGRFSSAVDVSGGFYGLSTGHATGGAIPGRGDSDTVPAMLTPGEFVINKRSAQRIGYGRLSALNRMAAGGMVHNNRFFYGGYGGYGDFENRGYVPDWFDPADIDITGGIDNFGGASTEARGGDYTRQGFDPSMSRFLSNAFQYFPPIGSLGWGQGPTMIPSQFNSQGYPIAQAVTPDYVSAQQRHATSGHQTTHHFGGLVAGYADGGIVDGWSAFASGGGVRNSSGMFTPSPGSNVSVSNTVVNVNVSNRGVTTDVHGDSGGLKEGDYREIGRMVGLIVDSKMSNARRVGGQNYVSRSQRGG